MNYRPVDCPDNLLLPLQNQWSDVEVRWSETLTNARKAHGDIFYVNIARYGGCARGHFRVRRVLVGWPGLPHLRTAATLMWK
jgi:hypothetical protein